MKRYLYIVCAVLLGVFASCSKSEIGNETPQSNQVTLKVTADEGLQTRANATGVDRFAIEVYTDATYATVANVFADGTNKANNATGVFTMVLDRTQAYHCLIWADKSGASVYDITSLKAVALTGKAVEAWQGTKTIAAGTAATLDVSLTRAVSKISLMETGKLKSGSTLKLNFAQPTKFNVVDGVASTITARAEESISIAADVDGTTTPIKLNSTDIFVLSSATTADLTDLAFQYDSEAAFTVSQAPLKANFNTNIKGHYTSVKDGVAFTVTADDAWGTPNEVEFPEKIAIVGDFYYDDNTFSNTLDAAKTCIGIVYVVNADGKTGKIVGLAEGTNKKWGPSGNEMADGINSATDGATATKNLITARKDNVDFATNYPAFEWVYTTVNGGNINGRWYLPARDELTALYAAWNGDATTTVNAIARAAFNARLVAVNASLSLVSGVPALSGNYWSSMQDEDNYAWDVYFGNGKTSCSNKDTDISVLVVSAF